MAIEALSDAESPDGWDFEKVIWNCKIALEQKEQEPIGYVSAIPITSPQSIIAKPNEVLRIPVYSSPQDQSAKIAELEEDIEGWLSGSKIPTSDFI